MKGRSVIGIILTVVGVVALVVGFFPGALVAHPKPGFGPIQIVLLIVGVVLAGLGYMLCCCKGSCCCSACGTKPETPQDTPPST